MSSGKNQKFHVGYKYFLGVQKLLCHGPIDAIRGIFVEDKKLDGQVREPGQHSINKQELFGEQQGGISGTFDIVEGDLDQPVNTYLDGVINDPLPAYRGVSSLVLNRMYLGNNPYLKPWSVRVSRIMKRIVNGSTVDQWYKEKATIVGETDATTPADLNLLKLEDGTTVTNTSQTTVGRQVYWDLPANKGYYWNSDDSVMYEFNINSMVVEKQYILDISDIAASELYFLGITDNEYFLFQDAATSTYPKWYSYKIETRTPFPPRILVIQTALGITASGYFLEKGSSEDSGTSRGNKFPDASAGSNVIASLPFGGGEMVYCSGLSTRPSMVYLEPTGSAPFDAFAHNWQDPDETEPTTGSFRNIRGVVPLNGSFYMLVQVINNTYTTYSFNLVKLTPTDTGDISNPADGTSIILKEYGTAYDPIGLYPNEETGGYYVVYQDDTAGVTRNTYIEEFRSDDTSLGTTTISDLRMFVNSSSASTSSTQNQTFFDGQYLYGFEASVSGGTYYNVGYVDLSLGTWVSLGITNDGSNFLPEMFAADSASGSVWGSYASGQNGRVIKFAGGGDAICPDMNPAHIIRECLTDQIWGLGFGDADIDSTSFEAAADQLFKEGFGISLLWGQQTPIEDFVGIVLDHIDANLYVDRTTGKFVLKLIRDDYTTYPTFEDSDILEISDFAQRPESELINSLTLVYNDRKKRTSTSVTVNDLAAIQQYGATIHTTVSYSGIYNHNLASKVAARDLRALSSPVYNGTIVVNRKTAIDLNVGDVFDIDSTLYPELSGRVYRVGEINFGNSSRSDITITFVEDVFSLGTAVAQNIGQIGTGSTLINDPKAAEYPAIFETDFYTYSRNLGDQTVSENLAYDNQRSSAILYADEVVPDALTFDVYSDVTGSYTRINGTNPSPVLSIDEDLLGDPDQTTVNVSFISGETLYGELTGNILAYVGSEIIQITDIASGVATIVRGVGDTVPSRHSSGSIVRVFSQTSELDLSDLVSGDSVNYKIATRTLSGAMTADQSATLPITFTGRIDKPWPVNNLTYNNSNYVAYFAGSSDLTWANQDKYLLTGATPPDYLDASTGLETNTTNNVTVNSYQWDGTLVATEVSATTTNESYTIDTSSFGSGAFYAIAEVEVENTVNSKTNHQTASLTLVKGNKSDFNGLVQWYDSAYFNTEFYSDSTRTTLLTNTADNIGIGAIDDVTGSSAYVYQDTAADEPTFKAADGGTYTVPYIDFSTDKSFKYDSASDETIYLYYIKPDGTLESTSQDVVTGTNTLTLSGEIFQFVISSTQLTTTQSDIINHIMTQGLSAPEAYWDDNNTWLDSDTWTE